MMMNLKSLRYAADLAGLTCLYEIHEEEELEKVLPHNPLLLGVNNRDLKQFQDRPCGDRSVYSRKSLMALSK